MNRDTPYRQVRCKSGIMGEKYRLRKPYANFEDFEASSDMYGVASRLGYRSAREAWDANPMIRSSVNPSDLEIVSK
jgi:hypothetical protein